MIDTLAERLDSEVELGSLSVDTIPSVHITGTALVIRHKNRRDVPPLVSVDSFTLDGGLFGLLSRPRRFRVVSRHRAALEHSAGGIKGDRDPGIAGFHVRTDHPAASKHKGSDDDDPGAIVVDRLVAENAALVLIPRRADKEPKIFDVRRLTMEPLGRGEVMAYHAVLTNPLPKGSIDTTGTFGTVAAGRIRAGTALTGKYTFDNVDLATVKGIGGHLTSTGKFQGQLDRIAVTGETRTPDFFVKVLGQSRSARHEVRSGRRRY